MLLKLQPVCVSLSLTGTAPSASRTMEKSMDQAEKIPLCGLSFEAKFVVLLVVAEEGLDRSTATASEHGEAVRRTSVAERNEPDIR